MTHQIIRLAEAVTITPRTDIEVVRLVEAVKAHGPQIVRTVEELKALDPDTVISFPDGHIAVAFGVIAAEAAGYEEEAALPAVVIATGEHVRAARTALEERTDGKKKYTVRYYNPIMGVYETHWDTQEEAEKEAAYDHGMNGAPTRVLDPDGNEIATFEEGQRHD